MILTFLLERLMTYDSDDNRCPKCGGRILVTESESWEIGRCEWCQLTARSPKAREGVILTEDPIEALAPEFFHDEGPVRVHIEWSSDSELAREVMIARRMIDELSKIPVQEFMETSKNSPRYDLGVYNSMNVAVLLQQRCAAGGLRITIEKMD